jgi:hypothetical protein
MLSNAQVQYLAPGVQLLGTFPCPLLLRLSLSLLVLSPAATKKHCEGCALLACRDKELSGCCAHRRMFSSRFAASISRFRAACSCAFACCVSHPPARLHTAFVSSPRRRSTGGCSNTRARAAQTREAAPARRSRSGAESHAASPRRWHRTVSRRVMRASPGGSQPSFFQGRPGSQRTHSYLSPRTFENTFSSQEARVEKR